MGYRSDLAAAQARAAALEQKVAASEEENETLREQLDELEAARERSAKLEAQLEALDEKSAPRTSRLLTALWNPVAFYVVSILVGVAVVAAIVSGGETQTPEDRTADEVCDNAIQRRKCVEAFGQYHANVSVDLSSGGIVTGHRAVGDTSEDLYACLTEGTMGHIVKKALHKPLKIECTYRITELDENQHTYIRSAAAFDLDGKRYPTMH